MDRAIGPLEDIEFTNKLFWETVPNGAWQGKPCYIVAGGPSLEKNWAWLLPRLEGQLTIGVNRAYEMFEPTIIFGMDPTFVRHILMGKYGEQAKERWEKSKAYKVWLCTYKCTLPDDVYILKCFNGYVAARQAFPFIMERGIGHGNNSGYAALNLAACLGANPIYLLGYDMYVDGTRTHWHNGHPGKWPDHVPDSFIKHFTPAAKELAKRGITVINLNPKSMLNCFPKAEISTGFMPITQLPRTEHVKRLQVPSRDEAKFGPLVRGLPEREPVPEEKLPPLFITGPYGFGDTIYLRSVVKSLSKRHQLLYLRTTLPEAFWDIDNVKFVRPNLNRLRSQKQHILNLDKTGGIWTSIPKNIDHRSWATFVPGWKHQNNSSQAVTINPRGEESTTRFFVNQFRLDDFDFSFPVKQEWKEQARKIIDGLDLKGKKLCIVRQPTIHKDWACYTRNPQPQYFQALVDKYKNEYFFLSLANNKQGEEWFEDGSLEGINKKYDHGELAITTIFGLIKLADMVITPPDFFSVLAIAIRTKCLCIFGGCAKPNVIFDENMGLENFESAAPEPFCNCMRMEHDCNKHIPMDQIIQKFESLKNREKKNKTVSVGIPPGIGDMHWVLEKLESFKEKNNIDELKIIIDRSPTLNYSRDFLRLIPFIDDVDDGQKHLPFRFSVAGGDGIPLQRNVNGVDYLIELNSRLEQGVRIENVLPEYDINYNYPIDNPPEAQGFAHFMKRGMGGKLYLFYASSAGGNNNWCKGTWEPKDWIKLANLIYKESKLRTVLIGAQWDSGYAAAVKNIDYNDRIQNFVGKTSISEALALLREANFLVSFLSGLAVLSTRFKIPCVSFWPTLKQAPHWINPEKFKTSWLPPGAEQDGYMPVDYGDENTTPEGIFKRLRKYL